MTDRSFFRTNAGIVYLAAILAVPAYIASVLIGLNPAMTTLLLLLFVGAAVVIHRLRAKRRPGTDLAGVGSIGTTGALGALAVFVLIQLVPYGRSHSNPAVVAEPAWPDAATRSLAVRACYDCHSNEVTYPWYANVAPISWMVANHVEEGRDALNFSDIAGGGDEADEAIEEIKEGAMPPAYFTRFGLHATAKLSPAEQNQLIAGLAKMPEFQEHSGAEGGGGEGGDED